MDGHVLQELVLKTRHLYIKLTEFENLTTQLAQAVDRRDEVSVQMLLNMRGEPAHQLQELHEQLKERLLELPEDDAIRAKELLDGSPQKEPEEAMLCSQVAQNQRLLARCLEIDKRISMSVDSKRSFHTKYR